MKLCCRSRLKHTFGWFWCSSYSTSCTSLSSSSSRCRVSSCPSTGGEASSFYWFSTISLSIRTSFSISFTGCVTPGNTCKWGVKTGVTLASLRYGANCKVGMCKETFYCHTPATSTVRIRHLLISVFIYLNEVLTKSPIITVQYTIKGEMTHSFLPFSHF